MTKTKNKSRVDEVKDRQNKIELSKQAKQSAIDSEADPKEKKKLQKELRELEKQDRWTVAKLRLLERYRV